MAEVLNEHISCDRIRQFSSGTLILDLAELIHLNWCDQCTIQWLRIKEQLLERVRNLLMTRTSSDIKAA